MFSLNTRSLHEVECSFCHEKYPGNYLDPHEEVCPRNPNSPNYTPELPLPTAAPGPGKVLRPDPVPTPRNEPKKFKILNNCLDWIKNHKLPFAIIIGIIMTVLVITITLSAVYGGKSNKTTSSTTDRLTTSSTTTTTFLTTTTSFTTSTASTTTTTTFTPTCLLSAWNENGTTIAGSQDGTHGDSLNLLYEPRDMFIDNNDVYITDTQNSRIMRYTFNVAQGHVILNSINAGGIAYAPEEQAIYFSSLILNNARVERVNKSGLGGTTVIVPLGTLSISYSLVVRLGNTYICDTNNHRVILWFNSNSSSVTVAGGNGFGTASNQLQSPEGIFVDDNLDIYIADTRNHRIQLWKRDTSQGTTVAGSSLGIAGSTTRDLRSPTAIIVDSYGTMFIADTGNQRILQWLKDDTEAKTILVGTTGISGLNPNQLNRPTSLKLDSQGNLIVVDNRNNRVQQYLVDNSQC